MVKIRLARGGVKKKPYYRIIVTDIRNKRDGKFIEKIGFYNPMTLDNRFKINSERVKYWISVGAQPTEKVKKLLIKAEIINNK